jgi:hypothetical protein
MGAVFVHEPTQYAYNVLVRSALTEHRYFSADQVKLLRALFHAYRFARAVCSYQRRHCYVIRTTCTLGGGRDQIYVFRKPPTVHVERLQTHTHDDE